MIVDITGYFTMIYWPWAVINGQITVTACVELTDYCDLLKAIALNDKSMALR